ncbi:hypothetical protein SBADM41S_01015 [Streptomyces badius]
MLGERVRTAAGSGGLVLVTGEPLSGKSRTAWAAMLTNLPGTTRLLAPSAGTDLRGLPAVLRGRGENRCVIWLDELEGHLGEHGLTPALLAELVRLGVPVIATMNDEGYDAHRFGGQVRARVLAGVEPVELSSDWTEPELLRLEVGCGDPRLEAASTWRDGAACHRVPRSSRTGAVGRVVAGSPPERPPARALARPDGHRLRPVRDR